MNLHYFYHSGLLGAACLLSPVYGGLMSDSFDVQTYRDFAENRGIFGINAKDVAIYDKEGNYVGSIPKMMNFDGLADAHAGEAALVGGPGFIATVSHDYNNQTITFTKRFGATEGTPFYDAYRSVVIKNAWGDQTNYTYDYRVQRLSKIVTEAEYAPYLTDPEYLDNMKGRLVLRAGSGTQAIATGNGKQDTVSGGYSYLTGGTLVFEGQASVPGTGEPDPENAKTYPAYRFWYNFKKPSESNPLPSGGLSGDSGSPCYVYNENSGKWEWVGAAQSASGSGYGQFTQMRSGNQWASDYVDSFNRTISVAASGFLPTKRSRSPIPFNFLLVTSSVDNPIAFSRSMAVSVSFMTRADLPSTSFHPLTFSPRVAACIANVFTDVSQSVNISDLLSMSPISSSVSALVSP